MRANDANPRAMHAAEGYILLAVLVTLFVLAALSFQLNRSIGSNNALQALASNKTAVSLAAESGLTALRWQTERANCSAYAGIASHGFPLDSAAGSFTATVNPSSGSPVDFALTATDGAGISKTLSLTGQKIYQWPLTTQEYGADGGGTYVRNGSYDDDNFGASTTLMVRTLSQNANALLAFELSGLARHTDIRSATLRLNIENLTNQPLTLSVHALAEPWVEGTGNGTETDNGATWHRSDGDNHWQSGGSNTHGGTYDDAAVINFTASTMGGIDVDITPLVKAWVGQYRDNWGLLLKTAGSDKSVIFSSDDAANTADRPKLVIVYGCECGETC